MDWGAILGNTALLMSVWWIIYRIVRLTARIARRPHSTGPDFRAKTRRTRHEAMKAKVRFRP
jgi:hypothetical protein